MSVAGLAAHHPVAASDIELVCAARAQNEGAFEELYRRYREPIAGFVRKYVKDDGRAEDVVQEAFVAAFRRIRQTDREIHFKPWIYEIARNAAIDQHRRSSRAQEVSLDVDGGLAAADRLRLTVATAPEASVIDKERFDNFRGALDELPETQHRIIVLRELEGLSYREIGVRMELSSAAVESALFRARRKLESEYEQLDTGRRCALIRGLMARLAEGVESCGDRRRLDRHSRRCWSCRRRARELGLGSLAQRPGSRALGLIPLPAFLRRLGVGPDASGLGAEGGREAAGLVAHPAFETVTHGVHKAVVVLASVIAIGGGGATLGGVGPLAVDSGHRTAAPPVEAGTSGSPARGAENPGALPKRSGAVRATPRGDGDARNPAPAGRPDLVRPRVSRPAPARPAPPALPDLRFPPSVGGRAPHAGMKAPTLPEVARRILPVVPRLPRPSDVPALPGLGVKGAQPGSGAPDISGMTKPLDGLPAPR